MKPVPVTITHPDGSTQTLDLAGLVRSIVDEHLAGLVAASDASQTPADRDLHIRALIRQELASLGGHLADEANAHVKVAGRSMVARYGVEPIDGG